MDDTEVIVVGAGLAGLAAARTLRGAGLDVVILEKEDAVGGRVRTDQVDGFLLDRGFQVILPDYPEFRRVLEPKDLGLRHFSRGVLVNGSAERWDLQLAPRGFVGAAQFAVRRPRDAAAVAAFSLRDALGDPSGLRASGPSTIEADLERRGISRRTIDEIFRPFLAGVFLDPQLATSSRLFHLIWRCFLRGGAAVPAEGMRRLPEALAAALPPGALQLSSAVEKIDGGSVWTADRSEPLRARAVIVATDATDASALTPGLADPHWNRVTTWYFAAPQSPLPRPTLMLDGASDLLLNTAVMSEVSPAYAPPGKALITASTPRDSVDEKTVLERLAALYQSSTAQWELIKRYDIDRALPAMPATHQLTSPARGEGGVYLCGDHRDTSSIQGALVSGRRVATAVVDHLSN